MSEVSTRNTEKEETDFADIQKDYLIGEVSRMQRFEWFRGTFRLHFQKDISLALGSTIELFPAPLSSEVQCQFMQAFEQLLARSSAESLDVCPTLHGTKADLDSIFQRGLLIPGKGNDLKVMNGSAHGLGIYTANLDAAWLAHGFCSAPALGYKGGMLVCAVLQTESVTHVLDAQVIFNEAHIVPLFVVRNFDSTRILGHRRIRRPAAASACALCPSTIAEAFELGYTRDAVLDAGYPIEDMMQEYTISELLENGLRPPVASVLQEGCSISQLCLHGYDAGMLKACGCTNAELKRGGYTATDLKNSGSTLAELNGLGYTREEVAVANFPVVDLLKFDYTLAELKAARYSIKDLRSYFAPCDLISAGFSYLDLIKGGCGVCDLMALGMTEIQSTVLLCSEDTLKKMGYDIPAAISSVRSAASASELRECGYSLEALVSGGYTAADFESVGYTLHDLSEGGLTATGFKKLRYQASDLKNAGLTLSDLKRAGYNAAALKAAGYSSDGIKRVFKNK